MKLFARRRKHPRTSAGELRDGEIQVGQERAGGAPADAAPAGAAAAGAAPTGGVQAGTSTGPTPGGQDDENRLRAALSRDPNDEPAFQAMAEIVRARAAEGHEAEGADSQRAADDAHWALAEELAQSPRAWYPLVELARLSIENDREGALRRLTIAAERDRTGRGLAAGVRMLREAGHPDDALGLGVGHWRPVEHDVEIGSQLVAAAVQTGRLGEARRHLEAMSHHPDQGKVAPLRAQLERCIQEAADAKGP